MTFLAPLALLLLAPLGGLILLLYMLRLKRRDVVVPSVMLWQSVLQDTQANAPFQKLKLRTNGSMVPSGAVRTLGSVQEL